MATQRLDEVKALALYSEVFHQKPTAKFVRILLGRTNKWQLLNFVCALSAIMHNNGGISMETSWQANFLNEFEDVAGSTETRRLMESERRTLLSELQLGLLARYALQFCRDEATEGAFGDIALRLLLATNELFARNQEPLKPRAPRDLFKTELQSAALPNQRFAHIIQRYYRFFRWLDQRDTTSPDWMPLRNDFQRLLKMTPEEYLTAAFVVLTPYLNLRTAQQLKSHPPYFNPSEFGASLPVQDAYNAFIGMYSSDSANIETLKTEPTFTIADLLFLVEKPLITFRGQVLFCPLPSLLEDAVNTRLFINLFEAYRNNDGLETAKRFSRLQGWFLETYVGELTRMLVAPDYSVDGEIAYDGPNGGQKSTDYTACRKADGATVFIEVTKTRFRIQESVFSMDEVALLKDLDTMVIKKARKMQKVLDDLSNGLFVLPQVATNITPLIVAGQSVPGLLSLKLHIQNELRRNNWLQSVEPLVHCDVEELEMLAISSKATIDLFALLTEKTSHPDPVAKMQSLKNYLHYYRHDISRVPSAKDTLFPEYEMALNDMMLPTLAKWGLPRE